jgi:hypothetical protein
MHTSSSTWIVAGKSHNPGENAGCSDGYAGHVPSQLDLRRVAADVAAVALRISTVRAYSSGVRPGRFHQSESRATTRRVFCSPPPPIRSCGCGSGCGLQ